MDGTGVGMEGLWMGDGDGPSGKRDYGVNVKVKVHQRKQTGLVYLVCAVLSGLKLGLLLRPGPGFGLP